MRTSTKLVDIEEFHRRAAAGSPNVAVRLASTSEPVVTDEATRTIRFVFSDGSIDRYNDTVDPNGWDLRNFTKNPVALFGHDASKAENVIGKASNLSSAGGKLTGDITFAPKEVNPVAETVFQMVKGGFLNAVSVGFNPIEYGFTQDKARPGGIDFKKQELLEISVVPIPALPSALVQARAAGIDVDALRSFIPAETVERTTPTIVLKDLWAVSWLAGLLGELSWLEEQVEWEAEVEGDGSQVPQMLTDALNQLGAALVAMTVEEVGELLGNEPDASSNLIGDDMGPMVAMAARFFRGMKKLKRDQIGAVANAIDDIAAGREIAFLDTGRGLATLLYSKAGRVLSASNEKALSDAHVQMSGACDVLRGVLDKVAKDDETDVQMNGDPDERERARIRARARARRFKK